MEIVQWIYRHCIFRPLEERVAIATTCAVLFFFVAIPIVRLALYWAYFGTAKLIGYLLTRGAVAYDRIFAEPIFRFRQKSASPEAILRLNQAASARAKDQAKWQLHVARKYHITPVDAQNLDSEFVVNPIPPLKAIRWGRYSGLALVITCSVSFFLYFRVRAVANDSTRSTTEEIQELRTWLSYEARIFGVDHQDDARLAVRKKDSKIIVVVPNMRSMEWKVLSSNQPSETILLSDIDQLWPEKLHRLEFPDGEDISGDELTTFLKDLGTEFSTLEADDATLIPRFSCPPQFWNSEAIKFNAALGKESDGSGYPRTRRIQAGVSLGDSRIDEIRHSLQDLWNTFSTAELEDYGKDRGFLDIVTIPRKAAFSLRGEPEVSENGVVAVNTRLTLVEGDILYDGDCKLKLAKLNGTIYIARLEGDLTGTLELEKIRDELPQLLSEWELDFSAILNGKAEPTTLSDSGYIKFVDGSEVKFSELSQIESSGQETLEATITRPTRWTQVGREGGVHFFEGDAALTIREVPTQNNAPAPGDASATEVLGEESGTATNTVEPEIGISGKFRFRYELGSLVLEKVTHATKHLRGFPE